eukprot:scaffold553372_cov35-Attheya_sp.AAC.1
MQEFSAKLAPVDDPQVHARSKCRGLGNGLHGRKQMRGGSGQNSLRLGAYTKAKGKISGHAKILARRIDVSEGTLTLF